MPRGAVSFNALLDGRGLAGERGDGLRWHLDRNEEVGREEIVLSGLIDDAKQGFRLP
jgi:hypothetical protein